MYTMTVNCAQVLRAVVGWWESQVLVSSRVNQITF